MRKRGNPTAKAFDCRCQSTVPPPKFCAWY